jgi:hypothetical protein
MAWDRHTQCEKCGGVKPVTMFPNNINKINNFKIQYTYFDIQLNSVMFVFIRYIKCATEYID